MESGTECIRAASSKPIHIQTRCHFHIVNFPGETSKKDALRKTKTKNHWDFKRTVCADASQFEHFQTLGWVLTLTLPDAKPNVPPEITIKGVVL